MACHVALVGQVGLDRLRHLTSPFAIAFVELLPQKSTAQNPDATGRQHSSDDGGGPMLIFGDDFSGAAPAVARAAALAATSLATLALRGHFEPPYP
ncbi:hypothetical protein MUK42_28484 [Musa troglodytarum]|uniref:Uncharacterized protein n=1 Tax=Musa troglodytarum TaxID=320322 RepID=A0A9E7EXP1_9LILI|nr:hypothetical protein MUK42_28484 [Musa troglodytarum]